MTNINTNVFISIQENDFDIDAELNRIKSPETGGVVFFLGKVRDVDSSLTSMYLEHYPGMTESSLGDIASRACARWRLHDIIIIHRVGSLSVGDNIVLVIASSRHRKDAFDACEFLIDYLKTAAPFWKKESSNQKESWVSSDYKDTEALDKWSNE